MMKRLVAIGFLAHLAGAAVCWELVDSSNGSSWYNKDFEKWFWLAATFAVLIAGAAGATRRSWKTFLAAGAAAGAALALECAIFVGWAVMHSA